MPQPKDAMGKPLVPVPVVPVAADPTEAGVDLADLKRKSVRGGAVTMISQAISIGIQLTSTVILARLLSPDDYGVMAMVMAVTGFAGLFRDLGLSSAAIQKKDLTDGQQSNLFWLNIAMGALITVLVAAGSPLVAWFYDKPELTRVTLVLSASFLIGSFGTQHGARLVREMQFARQAAANICGAIVGLVVSISFAFHGFSYWSLVWGGVVGSLITTLLLFVLSPFCPGMPQKGSGVRDMLKFGANVTAFDFVNYFHRNLDNILIGKFWGPGSLGLYSRAYQLLMLPLTAIRGPINAVAFPSLSRLQEQPEAYRSYYRKVTGIVAFLSMPLSALLFATSRPMIELVLGSSWLGVVPIFSWLAISGFIQPVASLRGMVMLSHQHGKAYLTWGIFNAIAVSLGFLSGIAWGPVGIAISYAVVNYAILYPSLLIAFKDTPLHKSDFFLPLLRPTTAAVCGAAIAHFLISHYSFLPPLGTLAISSCGFFVCYLPVFFLLPGGKRELQEILALRHQFQSRRATTS